MQETEDGCSQQYLFKKREQYQVEIRHAYKQSILENNRKKVLASEVRMSGDDNNQERTINSKENRELMALLEKQSEESYRHNIYSLIQCSDTSMLMQIIEDCQKTLNDHNQALFKGETGLEAMVGSPLVEVVLLFLLQYAQGEPVVNEQGYLDILQIVIYFTYQETTCQHLLDKNIDQLLADICKLPFKSSHVFNKVISIYSNLLMESVSVVDTLLDCNVIYDLSNMLHHMKQENVNYFSLVQFIINFTFSCSRIQINQCYQYDILFSMLAALMDIIGLGERVDSLEVMIVDHLFILISRNYEADLVNLCQYGIINKVQVYLDTGNQKLVDKTLNLIGVISQNQYFTQKKIIETFMRNNLLKQMYEIYTPQNQLIWAKTLQQLQYDFKFFSKYAQSLSFFQRKMIQLFNTANNNQFREKMFYYIMKMLVINDVMTSAEQIMSYDIFESMFDFVYHFIDNQQLQIDFLKFLKLFFQKYFDCFKNFELKLLLNKFNEYQNNYIIKQMQSTNKNIQELSSIIQDDFLQDY